LHAEGGQSTIIVKMSQGFLMHILEQYIAALASNDTDKIAECFTNDEII